MNPTNQPVVTELHGEGPFTHLFYCEGCGCSHGFNVSKPDIPIWSFNGDLVRPTVQPSILVRWPRPNGDMVCHSFITDGKIQYLGDCTHKLAGQTIELTPDTDAPQTIVNWPPDWE